jgi:hypothetical protein
MKGVDDRELGMPEYFVGMNPQDAEEMHVRKSEDGDIMRESGGFRLRCSIVHGACNQIWHELQYI